MKHRGENAPVRAILPARSFRLYGPDFLCALPILPFPQADKRHVFKTLLLIITLLPDQDPVII
jgi:hypothetical protein